MKTMNRLAIFAIVSIILNGCSGNSPKKVAEKFLKAMNEMDYEGAKKYGTDDTGKLMDMLSGFMKMMPDSAKKETRSTILSQSIDGDKATVTYTIEGENGEQVLNLVKVNDEWKVSMNKADYPGNADIMDTGATSTDTTAETEPDSTMAD